jgi:hypothetical protein
MLNHPAEDSPNFTSKAKRFRDKESNNGTPGKNLLSRYSITCSYSYCINIVLVYNSLLNLSENKGVLLLRFIRIKGLLLLILRFILATCLLSKESTYKGTSPLS